MWGCRCPGSWDNSCRWWSRLRTPWWLRAQPLPSMAKAELMLVDVDVDVGWTTLLKDLFFCIFVFLELLFCISGTFTNKRMINYETTLKTMETNQKPWKTMKPPWKTDRPFRKVIIFRDKHTDRTFLLYIDVGSTFLNIIIIVIVFTVGLDY